MIQPETRTVAPASVHDAPAASDRARMCMDNRLRMVDSLWDSIEDVYDERGIAGFLRRGASADSITDVEEALGLELPTELAYSLARHDGTKDTRTTWPTGTLLSCDRIVTTTLEEREASIDTALHWEGGWVAISRRPEGHLLVVDAAMTPEGNDGKIYEIDLEAAARGESGAVDLWAADYLEYLEMCEHDVECPGESESRACRPSCVDPSAGSHGRSGWKFWR